MSGKKLQVVLATRNKGKIRELAEPLAEMGVEVLGLDRFPGIGEIPENGSTFAENALVKAGTVADYTGLISVADDSGLEVDALGGRPGIYSARYSDDWFSNPGETKDQRNIRKLLYELKDVPYERRQARFVCCMAAFSTKPSGKTASGMIPSSAISSWASRRPRCPQRTRWREATEAMPCVPSWPAGRTGLARPPCINFQKLPQCGSHGKTKFFVLFHRQMKPVSGSEDGDAFPRVKKGSSFLLRRCGKGFSLVCAEDSPVSPVHAHFPVDGRWRWSGG